MRERVHRCVAVALALLACGSVHAAELGALTLHSKLGEPLKGEIEILSLEPGEDRSLVARLATPEEFSRARVRYEPAVADVTATIARRGGRPVVQLSSGRPMSEPSLAIVVKLQSNTGLYGRGYSVYWRTYALQLDDERTSVAAAEEKSREPAEESLPTSREALFGALPAAAPEESGSVVWRGFVQNTTAYNYEEPSHWSRAVVRTQLGAQGGGGRFKWRATARIDVDPVYAANDFYPPAVRDDQKRDFFLRETYIDTSLAGFDLRLGKQHIVWGEMVGLFFADVVSARDQRDFILPEFQIIRIPQWAARIERFGEDTHAELIWLPAPDVDMIGQPGADFYPFQVPPPAGFGQRFRSVERPERELRNSNIGMRASMLRSGWDLAAFYYRSTDVNPTFYREVVLAPQPTLVYAPRHDRIWQVGGTLGKDLGFTVLKAEAIYTSGRKFNVTRLDEPDGVVPQDTFDYVVGLDFNVFGDYRLNLQVFDRLFREHDPDLIFERHEPGVSLLLAGKIGATLEPELLVIRSANRSEGLVRAKLGWIPARNWRVALGADVFSGPALGFFGRFDDNDRVYLETRYDF